MTSTVFTSGTVIESPWLNDVNDATYNASSGIPGATVRTLLSKIADTVSVKDFGAIGDGSTDDTTAFQNMLNYLSANQKAGFLPQGIYRITNTLTYTNQQHPLSMYGETTFGVISTSPRIEFHGTFTDGLLVKGVQGSQGCDLRYLNFGKSAGSTVNNGLNIQNLRNPRLSYCSFNSFNSSGILFSDETGFSDTLVIGASVKNCYFNNTNNGILFTQTESGQSNAQTIDTCSFYGLVSGVRFEGLYSNNLRVLNCIFESISGDDLFFKQAVTVLIQGNYFESSGFPAKSVYINFWQGESGVFFDAINIVNNNFQGAVQLAVIGGSQILGMNTSSNHYTGLGNKPFLRITASIGAYSNLSIERPTKYQGDAESLTYTVATVDGSTLVSDRVFNYRRAPQGEAAAIATFDGTVSPPTIIYSQNIGSIVRNSTGDYTITFQRPLEAAEYATTFGTSAIGTACIAMLHETNPTTTTTVRVKVLDFTGSTVNNAKITVVVHGNF